MRFLLFILLFGTLGLGKSGIPTFQVSADDPELQKIRGILHYREKPFDGQVVSLDDKDRIRAVSEFLNGMQEGSSKSWDESGRLLEERYYHLNQKTGRHLGNYADGSLRFEYFFRNGFPIGIHKDWLPGGQLYQLSTYNDQGQPEGLQQLYFASGKIKANYEIKNGRRYGLLGAKGCMGENERRETSFE